MAFRTQIHKKKFGKNRFRTLQWTMSHRPLSNTSSLKITAAYSSSSCTAHFNYGYILHLMYCNVMYCTDPSQLITFKFSSGFTYWDHGPTFPEFLYRVYPTPGKAMQHVVSEVLKRASVTRWIPKTMKVSFTTSSTSITCDYSIQNSCVMTLKRGKYFFCTYYL